MSREIRRKQAYLREQNKRYGIHFERVADSEFPRDWPDDWTRPSAIFRNAKFLAQVFAEVNGATRISVMRSMIDDEGRWVEGISWEDLMAINAECGFAANWAVEIYPAIEEAVNVANMRHLFVLPEAPSFAWRNIA